MGALDAGYGGLTHICSSGEIALTPVSPNSERAKRTPDLGIVHRLMMSCVAPLATNCGLPGPYVVGPRAASVATAELSRL